MSLRKRLWVKHFDEKRNNLTIVFIITVTFTRFWTIQMIHVDLGSAHRTSNRIFYLIHGLDCSNSVNHERVQVLSYCKKSLLFNCSWDWTNNLPMILLKKKKIQMIHVDLGSAHRTSNRIFYLIHGLDCSNSVNHERVQVLSYCKKSLLFNCSWDWTNNLPMILLKKKKIQMIHVDLGSAHRTSNRIFYLIHGLDCSNSVNHERVQVLSYCKKSLLFNCSWDWTNNLPMILLKKKKIQMIHVDLGSAHRTSNRIFYLIHGLDCSNSVNHERVQVLSYCKKSLLFNCSWDWTNNLPMILLKSTFQPNTYTRVTMCPKFLGLINHYHI